MLAGPALAATIPAKLVVEDNAKMFSPDAIDKAKKLIAENKGQVEREVHLETYEKLSDAEQKRFDEAKGDDDRRAAFWRDWTKGKASGEKGMVIAINRSPGHVSVITSDTMGEVLHAGKTDEVEKRLAEQAAGSRQGPRGEAEPATEEQKLRDEGLISAMDYAGKHIPASFGTQPGPKPTVEDRRGRWPATTRVAVAVGAAGGASAGSSACCWSSCWCAWIVIGVIRAFSGGGGGYGGGPGMRWRLGRRRRVLPEPDGWLFGAAAGMWMYDHFLGGHSSAAYGGGDYGGGGATSTPTSRSPTPATSTATTTTRAATSMAATAVAAGRRW